MTARTYTRDMTTEPGSILMLAAEAADVSTDNGPTLTVAADTYRTAYAVRFPDPRGAMRWHRVYVYSPGNAGSAYVMHGGQRAWLDTDAEGALETVRDAADRAERRAAGILAEGDRVRDRRTGATGTHRGTVYVPAGTPGGGGRRLPLIMWDGTPDAMPWTWAPEALELAPEAVTA